MTKYIFKTMDMTDKLLDIRVNYKQKTKKKTVILITIQKSFFVKHIVLISSLIRPAFLSGISNLKNARHLKKKKK